MFFLLSVLGATLLAAASSREERDRMNRTLEAIKSSEGYRTRFFADREDLEVEDPAPSQVYLTGETQKVFLPLVRADVHAAFFMMMSLYMARVDMLDAREREVVDRAAEVARGWLRGLIPLPDLVVFGDEINRIANGYRDSEPRILAILRQSSDPSDRERLGLERTEAVANYHFLRGLYMAFLIPRQLETSIMARVTTPFTLAMSHLAYFLVPADLSDPDIPPSGISNNNLNVAAKRQRKKQSVSSRLLDEAMAITWPIPSPPPEVIREAPEELQVAWDFVEGQSYGEQTMLQLAQSYELSGRLGLDWENPLDRWVASVLRTMPN